MFTKFFALSLLLFFSLGEKALLEAAFPFKERISKNRGFYQFRKCITPIKDHSPSFGKGGKKSFLAEDQKKRDLDPEEATKPYLLPREHFFFDVIKQIFSRTNSDLTIPTIHSLGFKILDKLGLHVLVAKHPLVPGYVFKFFKYNEFPGIDWKHWIRRVEGAAIIQEGIKALGYKQFKVPRKWLFKTNSTQWIEERNMPCYVLIAEDMRVKSTAQNHDSWRTLTKEKTLTSLYNMLKIYGLRDCARVANVPYCKDGKIAFVDTESYYSWPVNYHPLLEFLTDKNKKCWKNLVKSHGDPMSPH